MSAAAGDLALSAYLRPSGLREALALAAEDPDARFVAGGTDLLPRLRSGAAGAHHGALISLRRIPQLRGISGSETLRIGAATTLVELLEAPRIREGFPALAAAAGAVGSPQVRSVSTIGGNVANASPCADLAPTLLVAPAGSDIAGPRGSREVPDAEFFLDRRRPCLPRQELVPASPPARPPSSRRDRFVRRSRVRMDLAQVSIAVAVELDGGRCAVVRIAAGAVAPTPRRLTRAEALLRDELLGGQQIAAAAAAAAAEIAPISDLRASADMRRRLTAVLLGRALARLGEEDRR